MTEPITDEKIIQTLREVAAERPDYVYTNADGVGADGHSICQYVHGEGSEAKPGCIVGHVLNRLGVPLNVLSAHEGGGAGRVARDTLGGYIGANARHALNEAQEGQDSGKPWSLAVSDALTGH